MRAWLVRLLIALVVLGVSFVIDHNPLIAMAGGWVGVSVAGVFDQLHRKEAQ